MRPSSRDPYLLKEVFLRSVLDTILNMISLSLLPCRKKKLSWNMLQRLKRQDSQWHAVKHFYPARNEILWRHRSHKSSVETNVFKTLHPGVWQDGMDSKLQMIEVLLGCNYPLLKQSELSALINRFLFFLETADTPFRWGLPGAVCTTVGGTPRVSNRGRRAYSSSHVNFSVFLMLKLSE